MTTKEMPLNVFDSRVVLQEAIEVTGKSKYAFAKSAGITPTLLNRYLDPSERGSQMTARKLQETLRANGVEFSIKISGEKEPDAKPRRSIKGGATVFHDFMKADEFLKR